MTKIHYIKSFEKDFALKTVKNNKKIKSQTIQNIVKTKTIKPNTFSFGRKKRLACTCLHKNYTKTYRSQGLIFQSYEKPDSVFPFDIVLLTNANKIIVQYYRIENHLHEYYNNTLIKGWEMFSFKTYNDMIKKISSPEIAWKKVNTFRKKNKLKELPETKFKLVQYNEIIFNRPIKITPIAIYGYTKESRQMAKKLNLPHYKNAKEFYNKEIIKK